VGEDLKIVRQQTALAEMTVEIENAALLGFGLRSIGRQRCWSGHWRHSVCSMSGACATRRGKQPAGWQPRGWRRKLGPTRRVLAIILAWQGAFTRLLEHCDSAAQLFSVSESLLDRLTLAGEDLRRERAFLLFQKAHLALHSDRTEAGRLHGQSAALFRAAGDDWWAAAALREQGRVPFYQGCYVEAWHLIEQSLVIRRALGDQRGIADSLNGLGILAAFQGNWRRQYRCCRKVLRCFVERGIAWTMRHAGQPRHVTRRSGQAGRGLFLR